MTTITNQHGRIFNVRIVRQGDHYGRNDRITHVDADPLVEFYDTTYTSTFDPRGQFVSRYYLSTLEERQHPGGLCLEGSQPVWTVTEKNVQQAIEYAKDRR